MDDQAVIRIYGNTDLPEGTPNRPLVTFALFAYNQEKYIREAIEGAFAQTYSPLEIILSDDCSSDRTFEIMEEMAREYRGPHFVKVRRNAQNVGTIDHLLTVARLATGVLMVVAAGDDISVPTRTEKCLTVYLEHDATAIYSGRVVIDDVGIELGIETSLKPMAQIQDIFKDLSCARRYDGKIRNIPGYSAAYRREFLENIPLCHNKSVNEDALTTYLVNIIGGKIEEIPEPLVRYRLSETSISHRPFGTSIYDFEKNEQKLTIFCQSSERFYPYLFSIFDKFEHNPDIQIIRRRLEPYLIEARIISRLSQSNFLQRLSLLAGCQTLPQVKIVIPRIFGRKVLALVKYMIWSMRKH
jgi:glycosyltransferase involved in cell wall biosynthesis